MFSKPCITGNYMKARRTKKDIKYIVVHFTANNGDTARGNLTFFANNYTGTSAHYFVDETEVCCSVPPEHIAYHCGGSKQGTMGGKYHMKCYNSNSIGVEMCSRKDSAGAYYFMDETISNAAEFIAHLMDTYGIPIDRVIRHYDVTGKLCPRPFIEERTWYAFKNLILRKCGKTVETVEYYEKPEDIKNAYFRGFVEGLMKEGIVQGDGANIHLSDDMIRCMIFCKRLIEKGVK